MVARIAKSNTGRNGQYVGTVRTLTPTQEQGSPTARQFNGTTDRLIGPRSNDLGPHFLLVMTFWRSSGSSVPNDLVGQRLFTQYRIGGTRVAIGINRTFLALTYTASNGASVTLESRRQITSTGRNRVSLQVTPTEVIVRLNHYEVFRETVTLAAPDSARLNIGSDANARFFAGWIDDVVLYQQPPRDAANWLSYYMNLADNLPARSVAYTAFAPGVNSTLLSARNYTASGGLISSRVPVATAWRDEPELPSQSIEFEFTPIVNSPVIRVGVSRPGHNLETQELGESAHSYAWTQDGVCRHSGANQTVGLGGWSPQDRIAMTWTPADRRLAILKNGITYHAVTLPAGEWTAAVTIGPNVVRLNAGQAQPYDLPLNTPGLPREVWSLLTTEFRNAKLGEVAAPLDDSGVNVIDAYSGAAVGEYLGNPVLADPFTPDSFDVSRKVGGGIRLLAGEHTKADDDFFFLLAICPDAADMAGEHVLLESPNKWGLRLLDGNLNAWVGSVQVGTSTPPLVAGERYLLGISRSPAGRLLVWSNIGYVLQSGDLTAPQTEAEVWVGSGAGGARAFNGRFSHVALSSKRIAQWKLDRLRMTYTWATPDISGAIPNPATQRKVFEPSWRDVLAFGMTTNASAGYVAAVAAAPDELALQYRMVTRVGAANFAGNQIVDWTPNGKISAEMSKSTMSVQLVDFENLGPVIVGQAAMIDDEILEVTAINRTTGEVSFARGCVDTVPERHAAGSVVWFYETISARSPTSHLIGAEVEVKLLTRNALTELEEGMAPTDTLRTAGRMARPYPPADVTINDQREPTNLFGTVQVKWKHRNKTTQAATLVSWDDPSVPPPTGLTYLVRAYDAASGEILHESSVLPNTRDNYDLLVNFTGSMVVEVTSVLNGLACLQSSRSTFAYTSEVIGLMVTEDDMYALDTEDERNIGLERISTLRAGSYSGNLPDDYDLADEGDDDEEEEEESVDGEGPLAGVPISAFPQLPGLPQPGDLFPVVSGQENYRMSFAQMLEFLAASVPMPQDGASAYEMAGGDAVWGSVEAWQASLIGPPGPATNVSRRIQTIASGSGAIVCNWALYDEIRIRLAGNVVLTFQGAVDGQGCLLKFQQDAVGNRQVTLPSNVRYNNLVQMYLPTPNPGLVDKVGFVYDNAQSTYDLVSIVPGISSPIDDD